MCQQNLEMFLVAKIFDFSQKYKTLVLSETSSYVLRLIKLSFKLLTIIK